MSTLIAIGKWLLVTLGGVTLLGLLIFGVSGLGLLLLCWALRKY